MFTDSHCHLSFPELQAQMPQIRAAMQAAQVERALCICTKLEEFDTVHALATTYDNFWSTVGVRFPSDEKSRLLKIKIEEILGAHLASDRPTQTI